jgi:hypothetical protein
MYLSTTDVFPQSLSIVLFDCIHSQLFLPARWLFCMSWLVAKQEIMLRKWHLKFYKQRIAPIRMYTGGTAETVERRAGLEINSSGFHLPVVVRVTMHCHILLYNSSVCMVQNIKNRRYGELSTLTIYIFSCLVVIHSLLLHSLSL